MKTTRVRIVQPRRRAVAIVWLAIILVALMGFAAMALDMGRVQLCKTELQTAADASARAAVWLVPELRFDEAIARTEGLMDVNDAGGGAIGFDVDQEDLLFGIWWRNTRTFEPLYGDDRVRANAVAIHAWRATNRGNPVQMTFAGAIGVDIFDVGADAVARIRGGFGMGAGGFGIFGRDYIRTNGNTRTDSYDPTIGPYDPNTAGSEGGIGTNGYLEIIGTSDINGSARWGPDGDTSPDTDYLDIWPNAGVTGWQAPLEEDLVFPPAEVPSSYNNQPLSSAGLLQGQNINLAGDSQNTMPGGTLGNPNIYVVNNFRMRGNTSLSITGPVEIYVTGELDLTGGTVTNDGDGSGSGWPLPASFKIFVVGNGNVRLGGGSALHAQIYAPDSEVTIHGTSSDFGLFGGLIGKSIDLRGNSAIHVDHSLEWPGQNEGFIVELVH